MMSYSLRDCTHSCAVHTNVIYKTVLDDTGCVVYDPSLPLHMQLDKEVDYKKDNGRVCDFHLGTISYKPLRTKAGLLHLKLIHDYEFKDDYFCDKNFFGVQKALKNSCKQPDCQVLIEEGDINAYIFKVGAISAKVFDEARRYNLAALGNCMQNVKKVPIEN